MHSSRMRTAHSSNRSGGSPPGTPWEQTPLGAGTPQGADPHPREQASPRSRPPWSRPPRSRPRPRPAVWNTTCNACWDSTPSPHQRPAARHAGIPPAMHAGIAHPPVNRITHTCKNITLPQLCCGR